MRGPRGVGRHGIRRFEKERRGLLREGFEEAGHVVEVFEINAVVRQIPFYEHFFVRKAFLEILSVGDVDAAILVKIGDDLVIEGCRLVHAESIELAIQRKGTDGGDRRGLRHHTVTSAIVQLKGGHEMNIHGRTFISWPEIWRKLPLSGHEMNLNRSTAISWLTVLIVLFAVNPGIEKSSKRDTNNFEYLLTQHPENHTG